MKRLICRLQDIPLEKTYRFTYQGMPCLIYREGNAVFACEAICPHMGGPLSEAKIEEGCITCPWHGWRFDLKSGHCENVSGQQLRQIELFIEDEGVYIDEGPDIIPPLP